MPHEIHSAMSAFGLDPGSHREYRRLSGGKFARVLFLLISPCLVNVRRLFAQRPTLRSAMSAFGLDPGTHFLHRRYAAGNSLDLVAQTSMRLSRLRQGAFSSLTRCGKIFGYVREPLLRRRVFRSSLAKTRRFAPFSAKLMPKAQKQEVSR